MTPGIPLIRRLAVERFPNDFQYRVRSDGWTDDIESRLVRGHVLVSAGLQCVEAAPQGRHTWRVAKPYDTTLADSVVRSNSVAHVVVASEPEESDQS